MARLRTKKGRQLLLAPLFFGLIAVMAAAPERVAHRTIAPLPEGSRKGTIVMLGGSEGGMLSPRRPLVRALRGAGYAVTAVATFDHPGLPATGVRVPLDAIAALGEDARRNQRCVGMLGVSRGSEAALLLATLAPGTFDATVAIMPAHVSGPAPGPNLLNQPAWTWRGGDVPFVPTRPFTKDGVRWLFSSGRERAKANHAIKRHSLEAQPEAVGKALFRMARVRRPVLLISAVEDHVWPSTMMARELVASATAGGTGSLVEHIEVPGDHFAADREPAIRAVLRFLSQAFANCGEP